MRVVVCGGGISGLTAALQLRRAGHDVVCVEASHPGGLIRTERMDGFVCELGPQSLNGPDAETHVLIESLGLAREVVKASPMSRRRFIYVGGRLRPVPRGPFTFASTNVLSTMGKLRLLYRSSIRSYPPDPDESLMAFGERRLGPEAARKLIAPAALGVFAGDAFRLSMRSAFPRLRALEAQHGSLLHALSTLRKQGGRPGEMFSFRDGLAMLPAALAFQLGDGLVRGRVRSLKWDGERAWSVALDSVDGSDLSDKLALKADAVILATPISVTVELLAPLLPVAARALSNIHVAPAAVVYLGWNHSDLGADLDAYGFLVARGEGLQMLGCQYESSIFPARAPPGATLVRAILGGVFDPGVAVVGKASLIETVRAELRSITGIRAPPDFTAVFQIARAIPQYELGHEERVSTAENEVRRLSGLHLLGYSLRGVGVNDCVRNATRLTQLIRST